MSANRLASQRGMAGALVFLAVFFQLNQRPAILQAAGEMVFLISVGTIALLFLFGFRAEVKTRKTAFLALSWMAASYLVGQALVTVEGISPSVLINALFVLLAGSSVLIISRDTWTAALKAFVYPTLAFSLSYLVTAILVLVMRIPLESLSVSSFHLAQAGVADAYEIAIYFPFSLAVGLGHADFFEIPFARAVGYFREPGIFQMLVVISYFGLDYLDLRFDNFWKIALIVTLLLTYSTAGIGCFIVAYLYYYVVAQQTESLTLKNLGRRLLSLLVFVPVTYWFIFGKDKLSLLKKLMAGSGASRVEKGVEGLLALQTNPILGVGYQNPEMPAISVLSAVGQIGAAGLLLFMSVWILPNVDLIHRRDRRMVFTIPIILTAVFAQPLFDKPVYILTAALVVAAPRSKKE